MGPGTGRKPEISNCLSSENPVVELIDLSKGCSSGGIVRADRYHGWSRDLPAWAVWGGARSFRICHASSMPSLRQDSNEKTVAHRAEHRRELFTWRRAIRFWISTVTFTRLALLQTIRHEKRSRHSSTFSARSLLCGGQIIKSWRAGTSNTVNPPCTRGLQHSLCHSEFPALLKIVR